MSQWIDFKALREQVRFEDVLRHYGVEVKNKGSQHLGYCPLPNHNGKKNSPSFSANLERGIFNCFGCGAKGNLIDFAALMEKLNPGDGADVRKAALVLQERFTVVTPKATPSAKQKRHEAPQPELPHLGGKKSESQVLVNEPLDFELKRLDPDHPYLDKRGFTKATIAHFGLGFCSKGYLEGRIAIPLHNTEGKLVGYAGRVVDDTKISEKNPKYRLPSKRERNGIVHEFHKLLVVYNSHRLKGPMDDLIVVEGFPSVWWLTQMGFPDVGALMGWSMSDEQADIIIRLVPPSGRVWLIPDGDEAGERCAASVFAHLGPHRFVRQLKLDEGKQPTDYPGAYYRERLGR